MCESFQKEKESIRNYDNPPAAQIIRGREAKESRTVKNDYPNEGWLLTSEQKNRQSAKWVTLATFRVQDYCKKASELEEQILAYEYWIVEAERLHRSLD